MCAVTDTPADHCVAALAWKRRVEHDPSLGYYADGEHFRYITYRNRSGYSKWLLQVRRLLAGGDHPQAMGSPIDTSQDKTLALCKAVAQAYEADAPGTGNRMTRAINVAYLGSRPARR